MLKIQMTRSAKYGVRVYVLRLFSDAKKTDKGSEQVGTFLFSDGCPETIKAQLATDELIQLENWLSERQFALRFGIEPDDKKQFTKLSLHVPKPFAELIEKNLYLAALQADIPFNPAHIMLEAYRYAIKNTTKRIIRKQGYHEVLLTALQGAGLSLEQRSEPERNALEGRVLFKALLQLKQPIGKTCTELEEAATSYGKNKRIFAGLLKEWAGEKSGQLKEMKKWYFTMAIDVLLKHDINPLSLLPPDKVADFWGYGKLEKLNLIEAETAFNEAFKPDKEQQTTANQALNKLYSSTN